MGRSSRRDTASPPGGEANDIANRCAGSRGASFTSLQRAELGYLRLYDLRHTATTLALAAGVSPKVVSEMLGHASVFTLDTYTHVLPNMQKDAARTFEQWLAGKPELLKDGAKKA